MKLIAFTVLASLLSFNALAADKTLVCMMGDAADMDITIEQLANNTEKISVVLMGMDGNTKTVYTNSGFKNKSLSKKMADSKEFNVMVSKSDLQDSFGGAYIDAGILVMENDKANQAFNVMFSAKDMIYTAICK